MNYTDDNRGSIQYRERRKQLVDFSGIRIGNITPTDCDGLIEYQNKAYVLFEIKYRSAEVPRGQPVALTRTADDFRRSGKLALLIIAEHDVDDPTAEVDAAQCTVRQFYWQGKWHQCRDKKLKDVIFGFIAKIETGM